MWLDDTQTEDKCVCFHMKRTGAKYCICEIVTLLKAFLHFYIALSNCLLQPTFF